MSHKVQLKGKNRTCDKKSKAGKGKEVKNISIEERFDATVLQ